MSTPLLSMARWARELRAAPEDVLRIARLQHLAMAGAVRRCGGGDPAETIARWEWDDWLLAGRTGLGAVPAAWARAAGHSVDDVLLATAIGNEIGGRIGLATMLGPRGEGSDPRPVAAAAAAASAWLDGLDAEGIAGAVAAAVDGLSVVPLVDRVGDPGAFGREALARGLGARGGDPDTLERLEAWTLLPGAFAGLGSLWLTRTVVLKASPGMAWTSVAVEAVDEILHRHVRAAEKRLRTDQVERVEIRVGTLPYTMERWSDVIDGFDPFVLGSSIKRSVGALVAFHERTPEVLADPSARAEEIAAVASRVEVVHDWKCTLGTVEGLAPVLSALGAPAVGTAVRMRESGMLPVPDARALVAGRLDRVLRALARRGDLGGIESFAWRLPVEVKLYTTRGGWWPERRSVPLGTGEDAQRVAVERFGRDPGALLDLRGPASDWLAELRA